jgi:hypothetical protein
MTIAAIKAFQVDANDIIVKDDNGNFSAGTASLVNVSETHIEMTTDDIDLSLGGFFTKTVTGATTFTVSGVLPTGNSNVFILELINGGTAVITWWSGVVWGDGLAPTLTADGMDVLEFYTHDAGITWVGLILEKDVK